MFCQKCGYMIDDNSKVCQHCGFPVNNVQAVPNQQPQYADYQNQAVPNQQPQYADYQNQAVPNQQPQYADYQNQTNAFVPAEKPLPMKWYKWLIYFVTWASAVVSIANAGNLISGNIYGELAEKVYSTFPSLKSIDIFAGICYIVIAALAIYTRFRLSGFKKNAPTMVLVLYAANAVLNLIYIIAASSAVSGHDITLDYSSYGASLAVTVIVIICNYIYFNKRKHLFIN